MSRPFRKEYWLDPNEEPAAYAFGMRPPECRVPLWNGDSPSLGSWLDANDEPAAYAFGMRPPACRVPLWNGDSPSLESLRIGDSPSPSCC